MRRLATLILLFLGTPDGAAPSSPRFAWLAGCWRLEANGRVIDESWMAARGGTMLGMSRTVRGDSLVSYEFLRLFTRGDSLVYAARPSGQAPAEFTAPLPARDEISFANPAHDFPQRIVYRRVSDDAIEARVEGTIGGRERVQRFPYRRSSCTE
jgi:hypothetical protein